MTAILKINLEKVVSNASWLRLINYGQGGDPTKIFGADDPTGLDLATAKPLSGIMTAELYSDPAERKNVKLAALDEDLAASWAPYIYVDLRSVPSNTTCIYIPVVAGLDGDLDNIRLEYSKELGDDPNAFLQAEWHNIPGMAFPGKEFKQHSRYSGSYAFEFADMNPYLVSGILNQYQATSADIDIDITNSFTIDAGTANVGNEILLPAFENDVNVNITLGDDFATWNNANPDGLIIRDADPENPFTGTITININGNGADLAATLADMEINLTEGTAVIAGEFTNASALTLTSGDIVIGDGTTTTSGLSWAAVGDDVKSIEIAENATVACNIDCSAPDNLTKTVIVAGELTGDITASPAATADARSTISVSGLLTGDIDGNGGIFVDVNVSGQVVGDIDLTDAVKGKITINGGDATDPDAIVVDGDVTMKGDVEVALTAEGEAISGTLSMLGAAKTLKLVQGYINEIEVNVNNAGSWEDKYIDVVLNDANEGLAAFLDLTQTEGVAYFTESVWDGEYATNATYKNQFASVDGAGRFVYTATQLARTWSTTSDAKLANNIDLKSEAFKGIVKGGNFEGIKVAEQGVADANLKFPTIKNLKLEEDNNGLFAEITAAATISNITIDGVTTALPTAAASKNIGAIAGSASAAVTIENVTVKNIAIAGATGKALTNVGGFIGKATAAFDATDATVAGSIDGYSCLGGFVGTTNSAATFDNCDASAITFAQTYNSPKSMDIDYAKVGGFVGNVSAAVAVTIADGVAPTSINYSKPGKMYVSDTTAGTGNFYTYNPLQYFIGFSGNSNNTIEATKIAVSTINGSKWCAEKGFGIENGKTAATDISHVSGGVTHKYLYNWPAK